MTRKKSNFLINRAKKWASTAQNPLSLSLSTSPFLPRNRILGDLKIEDFPFFYQYEMKSRIFSGLSSPPTFNLLPTPMILISSHSKNRSYHLLLLNTNDF
jgi:hypothetical protein